MTPQEAPRAAPNPSDRHGRILVIRQGYYPLDPRVRREVTALEAAGYEIDVLCMRRADEPRLERSGSVMVRRLTIAKPAGGAATYLYGYGLFLLAAAVLALRMHLVRHYSMIQVNSLPDQLIFAGLGPRLLGVPLLLDLHEAMPEFVATKFRRDMDDRLVRWVGALEQASIKFATFAITCTEQMKDAFVKRGADPHRIGVVLNSADEGLFDPLSHPPRPRQPGRFTMICHGTVEERYGIDTAIRAVAELRGRIPEIELRIVGEGSQLPEMRRLASDLKVDDAVRFSNGFVPLAELLDAIADADVGVVAMKRDSFRDLTQCNKMYDFISMRKPAVVSRTRSVEENFGEDCFQLFESDSPSDLARAVVELYENPKQGERLVEAATAISRPYAWPRQRATYLACVDALIQGRQPGLDSTSPDLKSPGWNRTGASN